MGTLRQESPAAKAAFLLNMSTFAQYWCSTHSDAWLVKCSQEQCRELSATERLSDQVVAEIPTRAARAHREGRGKQ